MAEADTSLGTAFGSGSDRPVTVERAFLITDVRGYTQFTREQGNAEAARLARRFAELAEEAVEARGGRVVEVRGDEVLAVFTGAGQAVRAAVELAAACAEERELDASLPLLAGAGVEIGEAVTVGEGFRGAALNTAARLCSRAAAGQVLVSRNVASRAADVPELRFESIGEAELKGLAAPIELLEATIDSRPPLVGRAPAAAAGTEELPAELEQDLPFVGGEHELAWLRGAWRLARHGFGRVAFVSGPPQSGKTRLAAELAAHALGDGGSVTYVGAEGAASAHALSALREAAAAAGPLLLVLDDLEAISESVADCLADVRADVEASRALVVALIRDPNALPSIAAIVERADRSGDGHRTLGPLSVDEIRQIAQLYAGADADQMPLETIGRASHGLPGRVHELMSEWAEHEATRRLSAAAEWLAAGRTNRKADLEFANNVIGLKLARLFSGEEAVVESERAICPYKGLASFEETDAGFFFGREQLIGELAARTVGAGLLAVVGPSGSGKSSLIAAGLLPSLRAGLLPGSERWRLEVIRPGEHPAAELESVATATTGERLVVVVDQFEEVFTAPVDEWERLEFIAGLVERASAPETSAVVLSMRGDFIDQCAAHPRLAAFISANQVLVGPMTRDELRRAIELPARRVGLRVEAALVESLVTEIADEPGGLPLLSTALVELWQSRSSAWLRIENYERTGGVRGAVARLAENAFEHLDASQREAARSIFLRLVATGEGDAVTRRRAPLAEFDVESNDTVATVLTRLTEDRLLTRDDGFVEVAHEALLREWPRLKSWLQEDADGRQLRQHLTHAAGQWADSGRDTAELYRGARLSAALDWAALHGRELNELEREFLAAGRIAGERDAQRQRRINRRLRGLLIGVAIMLLASVAAGAYALVSRGQARHSAKAALGDSLGAQAVADPHLAQAMLLGVEGIKLTSSEATQGDLLTALLRAPTAIRTIQGDGVRVNGLALSPNGRTLALEDNVPNIFFLDAATGRRVGEIPNARLHGGPSEILYTPDGKLAFLGGTSPASQLDFIDPATAKIVRRLPLPASVLAHLQPSGLFSGPSNLGGGMTIGDGGHRFAVDVADHVVQWSLPQGRLAERPFPAPSGPGDVFYTPGARQFVVVGNTRTVVVNSRTGRIARSYPFVAGTAAALSADGKTLLVGDGSGSVRFLDLPTGTVVRSSSAHPGGVQAVGFTPDGSTAITSGIDGKSLVWDVASHEIVRTLDGHVDAVVGQVVSADGTTLYTGGEDGTALAWDLTGRHGFGSSFRAANSDPNDGAWNVALSPDGRLVAVGDSSGTVNLWNAHSLKKVESLNVGRGIVGAVSFGAGGRTLLVARDNYVPRPAQAASLEIWGLSPKPHLIHELHPSFPAYDWASFSPDGSTVAAVGPVLPPNFVQHKTRVSDGFVAEWSGATGKLLASPTRIRGGGEANDVSFAERGTRVAVNTINDTIAVVDPARRTVLAQWKDSSSQLSWAGALSPDGAKVATVDNDGYLGVWDAADGKQLLPPIRAAGTDVDSVNWSPDGSRIVTATDGSIRLFDATDGTPIGSPLPIGGGPPYVVFSSDGSEVVATNTAGQVWLYPATAAGWETAACRLANRNLTRAEWSKFISAEPFTKNCR